MLVVVAGHPVDPDALRYHRSPMVTDLWAPLGRTRLVSGCAYAPHRGASPDMISPT
jgi:hypothetical protein